MRPDSRAWREIDLDALAHNAGTIQSALPHGATLMAVVKADAYGHGAAPVSLALQKAGIHAFAVACLSEGAALRQAGVRGVILILGYTPPEDAALLARWDLTQAVVDAAHGAALSARGIPLRVHLALDTGMRRLGIPVSGRSAIAATCTLPNLIIDGVFSHLPLSESLAPVDSAATLRQLAAFQDTVAWMRSAGLAPGKVHILSSYGLWNLPPQPGDYVRAGLALYGVYSDRQPVRHPLDLRPVLSLRARVACIRTLRPGETAGYGHAFRAVRETRLAVITIGYGDGLPRDLPRRGGEALLHGRRCPMAGLLCMDQLLVDVTALQEVRPGDIVTLIGRDGGERISAEALAERCGTIANELLARLSPRLALLPAAQK